MAESEPSPSAKVDIEKLEERQKIQAAYIESVLSQLDKMQGDSIGDQPREIVINSVRHALEAISDQEGGLVIEREANSQKEGVPVDYLIEGLLQRIKQEIQQNKITGEDALKNGGADLTTLITSLDELIKSSDMSQEVQTAARSVKTLIEMSFLYSEIEGRDELNGENWRVKHEVELLRGRPENTGKSDEELNNSATAALRRRREVFLKKPEPTLKPTPRERGILSATRLRERRGAVFSQEVITPYLLATARKEAYAQFNNPREYIDMVRAKIAAGVAEKMVHSEISRLDSAIEKAQEKLKTFQERQEKIRSAVALLAERKSTDSQITDQLELLQPKIEELEKLITLQKDYLATLLEQHHALKKASGQELTAKEQARYNTQGAESGATTIYRDNGDYTEHAREAASTVWLGGTGFLLRLLGISQTKKGGMK